MLSLFPYRNGVLQIRVNDSWLSHAEAHAARLAGYKGLLKPSSWDVSQRLGEIAVRFLLHKLGATSKIQGLEIGKRPAAPTTKSDLVVGVSCAPANERFNMGTKAKLSVFKKFAGEVSLHVAALYDPPFVDMIGWADAQTVLTQVADQSGRVSIPASELRTMQELMDILEQKKGK